MTDTEKDVAVLKSQVIDHDKNIDRLSIKTGQLEQDRATMRSTSESIEKTVISVSKMIEQDQSRNEREMTELKKLVLKIGAGLLILGGLIDGGINHLMSAGL